MKSTTDKNCYNSPNLFFTENLKILTISELRNQLQRLQDGIILNIDLSRREKLDDEE